MKLDDLRKEIDALNRELVELLVKRTEVARKIARIKKEAQLPILDADREKKIKDEMRSLARAGRISASFIEEIFDLLLEYTRLEMEMEASR
jgi:chorismate mutase